MNSSMCVAGLVALPAYRMEGFAKFAEQAGEGEINP